jgi:hypothetical protein
LNACWDDGLLRIELAALQEENFALDPIGFEDEELARLLAAQDAADGLTDEDAVPELSQTSTSIAGDVWILGNQMSFPFLSGHKKRPSRSISNPYSASSVPG